MKKKSSQSIRVKIMIEKIHIKSCLLKVPYLNSGHIKKYGNLVIKTADGLDLKINYLNLVSVSQMFKNILKEINNDIQDVVILSEFESMDLKMFRDFIMEGDLPKSSKNSSKVKKLFQSFGIDLMENKEFTSSTENSFNSHDQETKQSDDEDHVIEHLEVAPEIKNVISENIGDLENDVLFEELIEENYDDGTLSNKEIKIENAGDLENDVLFEELYEENHDDITLSNTEASFTDMISETDIDNNQSKSNEVKEQNLKTFHKISQTSLNDEDKKLLKKPKLDQEALSWVRNKSKKSKHSQKMTKKLLKQEVNVDKMIEENVPSISALITGLRHSRKKDRYLYDEISYEKLLDFKQKYQNNLDVKIPPPGLSHETYQDFIFPEKLEELEVVPSILADIEYVHNNKYSKQENAQCGVCGVFGLNTYRDIRDHHVRFHTIHYECPIEDCR